MELEGFPKYAKLREGMQVTIRPLVEQDGPALLSFFRELPEEDRLFLRDDVTQPEWIDEYIKNIDFNTKVPLVAEYGNQIVGSATLYRHPHGWERHVAQIRVAVARPFQRKGLGTAMAKALVKFSVKSGVEKMVAEVVDNQVGAKRAFEKLGFKTEAKLKGHVKDIHGRRRDLVILSNDVSHIWEAMEAMVADYHPAQEKPE